MMTTVHHPCIGDRLTHAMTAGVSIKAVALILHSLELFLMPFGHGASAFSL